MKSVSNERSCRLGAVLLVVGVLFSGVTYAQGVVACHPAPIQGDGESKSCMFIWPDIENQLTITELEEEANDDACDDAYDNAEETECDEVERNAGLGCYPVGDPIFVPCLSFAKTTISGNDKEFIEMCVEYETATNNAEPRAYCEQILGNNPGVQMACSTAYAHHKEIQRCERVVPADVADR